MALPFIAAIGSRLAAGGGSKLATGLNVGGGIGKAVDNLVPQLIQDVDVVVHGSPAAKRYDLYWLAVSAAFAHISNLTVTGLTLPKGFIALEYNSELNYVRFSCKQVTAWKQVWASMKIADPIGRTTIQLFGGPKDELTGGSWQWFTGQRKIFGVPIGLPDGLPKKEMIKTGWEGETILTKKPTYTSGGETFVSVNPSPGGDESSRGPSTIAADPSVIAIDPTLTIRSPEYLLFQMLSGPCAGASRLSTPVPPNAGIDTRLTTNPAPNTPVASIVNNPADPIIAGGKVGDPIVAPSPQPVAPAADNGPKQYTVDNTGAGGDF